jgi:hypothetical protein
MCPVKARVTLIALHYSDSGVFRDSSPDLHLEAAVKDLSWAGGDKWGELRFSRHESPLTPGSDVLVKLRIASDGCPFIKGTDNAVFSSSRSSRARTATGLECQNRTTEET